VTEALPALSILTSGPVEDRRLAPLSFIADMEILSYRESADARGRNIVLRKARHDWVLLLHEAESVPLPLISEIERVTRSGAQAWAFRISVVPYYRGRPLRLRVRAAEIRLIHRRHCRFDERSTSGELKTEGPVIRLQQTLRLDTYDSTGEHRSYLERTAVPHSRLRQILIFAARALSTTSALSGLNTMRYLWIEAGFDHSSAKK